MLPAPVFIPLLVELPVVIPGRVVPLIDDPVVVPPVADPPADAPSLVDPLPVCARANGLANVSAAANPRVTNFMMGFLSGEKEKPLRQANVPAPTSIGCEGCLRGLA